MNVIIFLGALFLIGCAGHGDKYVDNEIKKQTQNVPIFSSYITPESVSEFIGKFKNEKPPDKIIINSAGGQIEAGIDFGTWIFDKKISIEIRGQCGSSCANYIFPAAYSKKIISPAIVWWHGSIKQKDAADKIKKYNQLLFKINNNITLSDDESSLLHSDVERKIYDRITRETKLQNEFYKKIGVSEYIDRIGQEPVSIRSGWMIGVSEMKYFGVCNVIADSNYDNPNYLDKWLMQFNGKVKMKYFKMNEEVFDMLKNEISNLDYSINNCL